MYPFLTFMIIVLLAFGLWYTMRKGNRQADVSYEEQTDNPVKALSMMYIIGTIIVLGGIFIYIYLRGY
jgi:hypothetical protein